MLSKTVHASAWIYGRHITTNVLNIGATAILARQLTPGAFGLVALASVLLRFVAAVGGVGTGDFVIYDRADGHGDRAHAAFWLNQTFSLGVLVVGVALTPWLSAVYKEPALKLLLPLLLLRYFLAQSTVIPDALVQKTLNYRGLAIRDGALEIASSLGSVGMALAGCGVWSLVVPGILVAPIRTAAIFMMARWVPRFPLRTRLWKGIFKYSVYVMGSSLSTTILQEGDTIVIGKMMGATSLGLYNIAWSSSNLATRNVTGVVGKVAMPALSAVAHDPDRLWKALGRMVRTLGTMSYPLLIGLFVLARPFVLTLYGPQWEASILPLQILIIYALRNSVGSPINSVFNAIGKPRVSFTLGLLSIPVYLGSVLVGSRAGIIGVATGVTIARTSLGVLAMWVIARICKESFRELLLQFLKPLVPAIPMGIIVFVAYRFCVALGVSMLPQLTICAVVGAASYLAALRLAARPLLADLVRVIEPLSHRAAGLLARLLPAEVGTALEMPQ